MDTKKEKNRGNRYFSSGLRKEKKQYENEIQLFPRFIKK